MLARFLSLGAESSARIAEIVGQLQAADAADVSPNNRPQWKPVDGIDESRGIQIRRDDDWPGFQSKFRAITALNRYRTFHRVDIPTKGNSRLRSKRYFETSESAAAYALLMLDREGEATLKKLRQCDAPGCKNWFFGGRTDRKTCSDNCKQKKRPKTDAGKKIHALTSKISSWRLKERNASSLAQRKAAAAKIEDFEQQREVLKKEIRRRDQA